MAEYINVTMVETVVYKKTWDRAELAKIIGMPEDTSSEVLSAIVAGNWETAQSLGVTIDVMDEAQSELDGAILDRMIESNFDEVDERTWHAKEVVREPEQ